MMGVGQEIRHHMLQLMRVRPEQGHRLGQVQMHRNAVDLQGMLQQDQHVANYGMERHRLARRRLLPRQRQETLYHAATALHGLPEGGEVVRPRARPPRFVQVVELEGRHGQGIVEFMGHIGEQRP
jgi:hypothetical protein